MDIFEALAWPQKQTKGALAKLRGEGADEREWFSQGDMPREVWAAGNVAADLVLDPLNAIPVGLLAKAGKGVSQVPGAI